MLCGGGPGGAGAQEVEVQKVPAYDSECVLQTREPIQEPLQGSVSTLHFLHCPGMDLIAEQID